MIKISKYSIIVTIVAIIGVFIALKLAINSSSKYKEIKDLYEASQDSMIAYRNDLGQQVAKVSVLQTTNDKYFLELKTKDEQLKHLQNVVKEESKKRKEVEVALSIVSKTFIHLRDSLVSIVSYYDSIRGKDTLRFPTYEKIFKNDWVYGTVRLGLKEFDLKQTLVNKYDVVIGSEPDGIFKRKQYAKITSLNPYTETESIKVYQKKPVKNHRLIDKAIGAGIMYILTVVF